LLDLGHFRARADFDGVVKKSVNIQLFVEESEHLEVSQKLRFRLFKELLCLLLLG